MHKLDWQNLPVSIDYKSPNSQQEPSLTTYRGWYLQKGSKPAVLIIFILDEF